MATYFKYPEAERTSQRVNLKVPNFEYLMLKAQKRDSNGNILTARNDILKKIAIHYLGSQMLRAIQIVQDANDCAENQMLQRELPKHLLNWMVPTSEENDQRRDQNLFLLDILQKFLSNECLDLKKLYNDTDMLQHYIKKLLQSYIMGNQDVVYNELENMTKYLNKLGEIEMEFADTEKKLETVSGQYHLTNVANRLSRGSIQPIKSKQDDMRLLVENAIEFRFMNGFCRATVEEVRASEDCDALSIAKQIKFMKMKIENEEKAHSITLSTYNQQRDKYRYKLYYFNERHNRMYTKYQGEIDRYTSILNWMRDQMAFYEEAIKIFHKRLVEAKLEDEAKAKAKRDAEEAELRRFEEEKQRLKELKLARRKELARQRAQIRRELLEKAKRKVRNQNTA